MGPYRHRLNVLRVDDPCPVPWESLEGLGPMRFCGICDRNVYDLSAMTIEEARELLTLFEGSACVRMRQRADGTLVSQECGDARARARRRALLGRMARGAVAAAAVAAVFGVAAHAMEERPAGPLRFEVRTEGSHVMGEMSVTPTAPGTAWVDPETLPALDR